MINCPPASSAHRLGDVRPRHRAQPPGRSPRRHAEPTKKHQRNAVIKPGYVALSLAIDAPMIQEQAGWVPNWRCIVRVR